MGTKDARDSPYSKRAKESPVWNFKCEGVCRAGSPTEKGEEEESPEEKKTNIKHETDFLILLSLEPSQFLTDKWGYVLVRCSGNTGLHGLKCFILNKTDLIIKEKSIIHFEQRSSTGVFQGLQKN